MDSIYAQISAPSLVIINANTDVSKVIVRTAADIIWIAISDISIECCVPVRVIIGYVNN